MKKKSVVIPFIIYLVALLIQHHQYKILKIETKHQLEQMEQTYQFRELLIELKYQNMVKDMGVNLTGDWDRIIRNLDNIANKFEGESSREIGKGLGLIERKVLKHIDSQDLGHQELSPEYAKQKERKGLDPDILRASNQMYENITTHQENDFEGAVGVNRGVKTKDGEDLTDIAIIHEQPNDDGSKIPARKIWKPTFDEAKEVLPESIMGATKRMFND
ncbi:MAG: hypothetical protein GY714_10470 [Desulfobacterales bacterium]|nr:hypothetical protein [Desulfobacterales bacterium]